MKLAGLSFNVKIATLLNDHKRIGFKLLFGKRTWHKKAARKSRLERIRDTRIQAIKAIKRNIIKPVEYDRLK